MERAILLVPDSAGVALRALSSTHSLGTGPLSLGGAAARGDPRGGCELRARERCEPCVPLRASAPRAPRGPEEAFDSETLPGRPTCGARAAEGPSPSDA